nr:immunoglobulin heavy chain junction region [Macaca mulatta]
CVRGRGYSSGFLFGYFDVW